MTDTVRGNAPPQTPAAAQAARAEEQRGLQPVEAAAGMVLTDLLGREDRGLERVETIVTIPRQYQYKVRAKVGLSADGYDFLNRVVGASFWFPEKVPVEGEWKLNPYIVADRVVLRLCGTWYTPIGQLVLGVEDVITDWQAMWAEMRASSDSAQVIMDGNLPAFDAFGNPSIKVSPADELKAIRDLSRRRVFGPRYTITVARVRLLKMATGIRSLPVDQTTDFRVKVVGYRDKMSPMDRINAAGGDLKTLYGNEERNLNDPNLAPLTNEEAKQAGLDEDIETDNDADRDAAGATANDPEPENETSSAAKPVGPAPVEGSSWVDEAARDVDKELGLG